METITLEKLHCEKEELREKLKKLNIALNNALAAGEPIENTCGLINKFQKDLEIIIKRIRSCEPNTDNSSNEQDRKAIAIIGGGRGVDIRAKNDDATKYAAKKKLSYDEIIKKRTTQQSNGHSKQQQSAKI